MAAQSDERTPLLTGPAPASATSDHTADSSSDAGATTAVATPVTRTASKDSTAGPPTQSWLRSLWSPANRVLLAGFIISLSFAFTQVSIFYVFRLMECDVFYETHPPFTGEGDRCSRNEIAAGTATQFSILGMSTTFFGTWNLFVTGHQVKHWGPRTALVLQTSIPAIRVATQIVGVWAGGQAGIWIMQITQAITIFGGPAGYILVVNTIAGEVVPPVERTGLFGKLQGCLMLGMSIGLLLGGIVGDTFGIVRPFQLAFFLFCFASLYARAAMPYISPESLADPSKAHRGGGLAAFFEPLKVMLPQRVRLRPGSAVRQHYGVFFLCFGNFLGVLATGYAPTLLQMYATAVFDFNQADNGWLMAGYGFMRAIFLIFIFPRVVDGGRHWFARRARRRVSAPEPRPVTEDGDDERDSLPTDPELFDAPTVLQTEEEPILPHPDREDADAERAAYAFDLFFLRWSLLLDGILTAGAALATKGWHMYLLTVLLPFGSGSAPAAKGVITSMCPPSQRTDALNAITLMENIGRLATFGLFGFIFSALANIGHSELTFYCNGAIAVVAMLVLMWSHFPPPDSELVDDDEVDDSTI